MHISRPALLSVLAYGFSVSAAPATTCNTIDAVYVLLRGPLKSKANDFCLSYLGGNKVSTVGQTRTVTGQGRTVTVSAVPVTEQQTDQVTSTVQQTVTDDVQQPNPTVTVTSTVTAGTSTVYQKRSAEASAEAVIEKRAIPPQLAYFASTRISRACSCIVTPTTKTVTRTALQTVAGAQATQTIGGGTVVVTVTQTVQITSQVEITRTLPASGTDTVVVQTTFTPVLIKPKICNARGLPGPGAFNYDANFNSNQAACIASCKTDNRCLSTGFYIVTDPTTGSSTGTCRKYDKSVTDSADLGPGYYNFNDKAC
ncbi:hypothetical protein N0V90_011698 [Kalmusia sp. IMI 367209]|nr:hypothetical protein N0V90_011698 [Kalmusia sp. IMI 367209]